MQRDGRQGQQQLFFGQVAQAHPAVFHRINLALRVCSGCVAAAGKLNLTAACGGEPESLQATLA